MPSLKCGHDDTASSRQICVHLVEFLSRTDDPEIEYLMFFDGTSKDHALICAGCRNEFSAKGLVRFVSVCAECFRRIEDAGYCTGVIGQPLPPERQTNLQFVHRKITLDEPLADTAAICPAEYLPGNVWLVVNNHGDVTQIDLEKQTISQIMQLPKRVCTEMDDTRVRLRSKKDPVTGKIGWEPFEEVTRLKVELQIYASQDASLIAVVNNRGKYGVVADAETKQVLMQLDRGFTYYHATDFPLAFFTYGGSPLVVHGTEWNRLDVSDPVTGKLLSSRELPKPKRGQPIPVHYRDYFHASLRVSPRNEWIADWGWVWHPVGSIAAWNLRRWLKDNVWESEDGETLHYFCSRDYYWDGPLCWIDDSTLCVWGRGVDADCLLPSVCLFDIATGDELKWLHGVPNGKLEFDEVLFSYGQEHGTSVWDIETGERLLNDPLLKPIGYHHQNRQFLSILEDGTIMLSHLEPKSNGGRARS